MSSSPQSPEPPDAAVPDAAGAADYDDGVPTFDFVRDRIEGRYATALGTTELAEESAAGRSLAQQQEDRDKAARERLDEIRRSLREN
jgi:phage shock protein A